MTSWRKSAPLASFVVGTILVIQFAVPTTRLVDDHEASRFGWQMFSGSRAFPSFVVETDQDEEREINLSDYLVRQRVEIDIAEALPPHLCEVIPRAVVVRWDEGLYRC